MYYLCSLYTPVLKQPLILLQPSLMQFFISKQWINRFNTFAEPGPITNDDFLCPHGGKEHNSVLTSWLVIFDAGQVDVLIFECTFFLFLPYLTVSSTSGDFNMFCAMQLLYFFTMFLYVY